MSSLTAATQQGMQRFTLADGIGLTDFGLDPASAVQFSPDGTYIAVYTERGHLDLNRVEDALRFYRTRDIENFLYNSADSQPPAPIWIISMFHKEGAIISNWRWLSDSSGVAFLQRMGDTQNYRLSLADLKKKVIAPLTSRAENITAFDIRDRQHYLYTAASLIVDPITLQKETQDEHRAPVTVGTGRSIGELLFGGGTGHLSGPSRLWAVVDGARFEIKHDGASIDPDSLEEAFALSPDGRSVVAALPVTAPASWATLYPAPYVGDPFNQLQSSSQLSYTSPTSQYVWIDLHTGVVQNLTNAPTGESAGWGAGEEATPSWSSDGQEVILPGTFLGSPDHSSSRPCIAVVNLHSNNHTCVYTLKGNTETGGVEEGFGYIAASRFIGNDKQRLLVSLLQRNLRSAAGTTEYQRTATGTWEIAKQFDGMLANNFGPSGLEVTVEQGLNDPPRLVAANKQVSRVIWDPNPQLQNIKLEPARVYTWKDTQGRNWVGGLYLPTDYNPGHRYPLVIQTHGFSASEFEPSGFYTTASAARALAATGIAVLQVDDDNCPTLTPQEVPCHASGYEAAARRLVTDGIVDPHNIGIIGFSRTCMYVLQTLTNNLLHFKAASISDGYMETYFQYMIGSTGEAERMIGAPPFGRGLRLWLERSPGFNLDKINTPLLVNAEGPSDVLFMWEPYAALSDLHKPVDLLILDTDEHVIYNPVERMVSQGGSVDWFRFWLQGYEDPDPAKADQYRRWEGLRKLP